jgi:fructose/tagatose bisphosphate aldolase
LVRRGKSKGDVHGSGKAPVAELEEVMVYCTHKVNGTGEYQVAVAEEVLQDVR